MGQREDVAQYVVFVIHEDVGIADVGAGAEGAGTLAFVFVAVRPAGVEAASQGIDVFAAQGA